MLKLHLGCGSVILPNKNGWVNVDIRDLPGVDLISSVELLKDISPSSVDLIYASHILEHFPRRKIQPLLEQWLYLLKPGGTLRLSVPSFEACMEVYRKTKNMALLLGHLIGGQETTDNIHLMVFDAPYLSTLLSETGYHHIRMWDWRTAEHSLYDDHSQGYYPHMDKENGILMSLNMEADK